MAKGEHDHDDPTVPPAWLAALWGVTERQVRRLAEEGVVPAGAGGRYPLYAATRAYCTRLREQAAGRLGDGGTGGGDLVAQRARLAREQADAQEMRNAVARGELIPRGDVVAGMQGMIANARARLLAIPSKAAPLVAVEADPRAVQAILGALVEEALYELAHTRVVALGDDAATAEDEG